LEPAEAHLLLDLSTTVTYCKRYLDQTIMITLTDGEPSDYDSVRSIISTYRLAQIHMVAVGVGHNVNDAINIGHNLKDLGFEKTLASQQDSRYP
jgi:hypothetical protein